MSALKVRLTTVIMDVLDILTNSPPDDPAWGLRLCEVTGYGTGTIYPALERLMDAGIIVDHWEDPPPADRPRRRYYELTSTGREWFAAAMRTREERRANWFRPVRQAGATS
jgi:PadR family transcriptional regulator PadR